MSAGAAVAALAAATPPVPLATVLDRAELQTRLDRKYLVPVAAFAALADRLAPRLQALELDGRRTFAYHSTYFDTAGLTTYHAHRQGRRRRYKVRTRSYVDSRDCRFEVKLNGPRETTVKVRTAHPFAAREVFTPAARDVLRETLARHAYPPVAGLVPSLTTAYERATFLVLDTPVRLTCDSGLVCSDRSGAVRTLDDHVLVEVKSPSPHGAVDRALLAAGVRPASLSKYCAGLALLHRDLPSNPWHLVIRRHLRTARASMGVLQES